MNKIVMLARLYWPHVGGVETHVQGLCGELKKRGYAITLITEQYDRNLKLKEYFEGVKILRLPYSALGSKLKTWQWVLKNKKEFETADLVHAHDVGWWYAPLKFLMASKPFYITFHGYEPTGVPRLGSVLSRKLVELTTDGSIAVGAFIKKWYWARPTFITYGAADVKPTPLPKNRAAVFVGRIEQDTGIFTYLRGLRFIQPPLTLDIYGEGAGLKKAQLYAKKHSLPVAFHGVTKDPEVVIRKARYIFTSQYLTMLAAMQAKRLVVAVFSGKLKHDYLECHPAKDALIVAGNAEGIVESLSFLDRNDEEEKIEKAYQWAKQQTWKALTEQYLQLWRMNR